MSYPRASQYPIRPYLSFKNCWWGTRPTDQLSMTSFAAISCDWDREYSENYRQCALARPPQRRNFSTPQWLPHLNRLRNLTRIVAPLWWHSIRSSRTLFTSRCPTSAAALWRRTWGCCSSEQMESTILFPWAATSRRRRWTATSSTCSWENREDSTCLTPSNQKFQTILSLSGKSSASAMASFWDCPTSTSNSC